MGDFFLPIFFLLKKFYTMDKNKISGRIVEIELLLQQAVWNGHKCSLNDQFQHLRVERDILRCLYFGDKSNHCKRDY